MIERHGQGAYYHSVVEHAGTLYLSGVVADDFSASMAVQTKQVLDKIGKALTSVGGEVSKILSATVYISDFDQKDAMNEAWQAWFAPDALPARTTVEVSCLGKGVLVEISMIAAR